MLDPPALGGDIVRGVDAIEDRTEFAELVDRDGVDAQIVFRRQHAEALEFGWRIGLLDVTGTGEDGGGGAAGEGGRVRVWRARGGRPRRRPPPKNLRNRPPTRSVASPSPAPRA